MAHRVSVAVPSSIADLQPDLALFFKGMVTKLAANSHKKPPSVCHAEEFLSKLFAEMLEAHEQWIRNKRHPNMVKELFDISNFAFLMSVSLAKELERKPKRKPKRKAKK